MVEQGYRTVANCTFMVLWLFSLQNLGCGVHWQHKWAIREKCSLQKSYFPPIHKSFPLYGIQNQQPHEPTKLQLLLLRSDWLTWWLLCIYQTVEAQNNGQSKNCSWTTDGLDINKGCTCMCFQSVIPIRGRVEALIHISLRPVTAFEVKQSCTCNWEAFTEEISFASVQNKI